MIKFDAHLNLEQFPTSKSSNTLIYSSVEDMSKFIQHNNITNAVVLYPRDDYCKLQELQNLVPGTSLIGLQVLMGVDSVDATDSAALKLDVLDAAKPLCKGIKIASHRGWWNRKGVVDSGFDYGKDSNMLHKWLKQLPENAIVSMHLQGDPINNSASIPQSVAMYAYKYPKLKFIMNHCGDYGQGGLSNRPKHYITQSKAGPTIFPAFRYAHSRALLLAAIEYTNIQHNIILESSVYIPNKSELLQNCKCWCIGSDYPFTMSQNLFINEEKKFIKDTSEEYVQSVHNNTAKFFSSTWQELVKDNIKFNSFKDFETKA